MERNILQIDMGVGVVGRRLSLFLAQIKTEVIQGVQDRSGVINSCISDSGTGSNGIN